MFYRHRGAKYANADAKEQYGVDSFDDLNDCYAKKFYCMNYEEDAWCMSLEEEIRDKTGLPFEEVIIEEGEGFDD